ncbi:MAG: TIGR04438 family Trp-rich protein [Rubrivivax sp.]
MLLALKLAELGAVATWPWWAVLAPFGLAVLWWGFADAIGLTQRRAMQKMEDTKVERRNRNLVALGLDPRRDRRVRPSNRVAKPAASQQASNPAKAVATEETTGH